MIKREKNKLPINNSVMGDQRMQRTAPSGLHLLSAANDDLTKRRDDMLLTIGLHALYLFFHG